MRRAAQGHAWPVYYHRNISFDIGIKVNASGRSEAIFMPGYAKCGAGGDAFFGRINFDTGGVKVCPKKFFNFFEKRGVRF